MVSRSKKLCDKAKEAEARRVGLSGDILRMVELAGRNQMSIAVVVCPGSDDAFIAWTSDFIPECRGFALYRRIKRGPQSPTSPNTVGEKPDLKGFVEEIVASWVGFANGPDVEPGTRKPTTVWPI